MSATLGVVARRPFNRRWLLGALAVVIVAVAIVVGGVIGAHWFAPAHPAPKVVLGGPGAKIVKFNYVTNEDTVCLPGNPHHPPCYRAFMPYGTTPHAGIRYYAKFFTLRTPNGVSTPAVTIISVASSKYS